MSKLHEIIAVEADVERTALKALEEAQSTFHSKHNLFQGFEKKLEWLDDREDPVEPHEETTSVSETVDRKLEFLSRQVANYWDVLYQKEKANQDAKADLVLEDGTVLLKDVPATYLLGMEKRLKLLRSVYERIPTLPAGVSWIEDNTVAMEGVYRQEEPQRTFKTEKKVEYKVLYDATDKHPAQIEKWNVDKNVGVFTKNNWSGMISSRRKSEIMGRIDELLRVFKKARQRANEVEVPKDNVANTILSYING